MLAPLSDLTAAHRRRLENAGVDGETLATPLVRITAGLTEDWSHSNALYAAREVTVPDTVKLQLSAFAPRDALVVLVAGLDPRIAFLPAGEGALIFLGPKAFLPSGEVYCGGGSTIVLHGDVSATGRVTLDARNGGRIVVAPGQLWAEGVCLFTDDMHRLEDRDTGQRVNPFGGVIDVGPHVWLGRGATLSTHVSVGEGSVVAMMSLVRGQQVPPFCAVAGVPARVIRENVAWHFDDRPDGATRL